MDCLRGPEGTESTVHYYPIVDTYEAINLFKLHPFVVYASYMVSKFYIQ